jgi:hypothetical protein
VRRELTGNPEADGPWDARRSRPGYEFEDGPPGGPAGTPRPPVIQGVPAQPRPARSGRGRHAEPNRFRYTPTVSAGAPQPWPEDRPGYEFDGAFPVARRTVRRPELPPPSVPQARPRPGPAPLPPIRPPQGAGPVHEEPAHAEWARLLRSLLPQPAKRTLTSEFLSNLQFRGWGMRVAIPILTMISVGIAVVVFLGADSGNGSAAPSTASLGFPPATLAGGDFTVAPSARGITESLGRVASAGDEIVTVGAETGTLVSRAQFLFSLNDGGSWSLGTESAATGSTPPPGHPATLVAGGQGEWVALGPESIWTSDNGEAWTLVDQAGLPARVTVLRRTASGFIAVGSDALFLSATGTSWDRLAVPFGAVDIRYAATSGNSVLIAGEATGGVDGAWLSRDDGRTWTPAAIPGGHGSSGLITGVATVGGGFVLARPATVHGRPATDLYQSADGAAWAFAATLEDFTAEVMNGGPAGAVVTGVSAGALTGWVSEDGVRWQRTRVSGRADKVSGAAITGSGTAVVTTDSSTVAGASGPQITTFSAGAAARPLSLSAIPGAVEPQLAINAITAQGSGQVAVGSANGYPATWMSTDGGTNWTRGVGQTPAVLVRPGEQQLTSVTSGSAGWVAVGGVTGGAPQHPVVIVSMDGSTWAAADTAAAFAGSGLYTSQATASSQGYVIVGYQQTAGGGTVAAAWWSSDLTGWQRASEGAVGTLDGASGSREMLGVTALSSGLGFVAVGVQGNSPAVWTSPDGKTWSTSALPLPAGAARAVLLHVAAAGRTVVAVGMAQSQTGAVWPFSAQSANGGMTWSEGTLPVPSGVAQVTALAAADGTFTATGTFGTTPGHQDVVVWMSSDGATWTDVTPSGQGLAGPGIQAITGLTVSGSTLTGVGFTASPASEEPVFWQSPLR